MKWRPRRRWAYEPPHLTVMREEPWMDKTITINGKPTTLRVVRKFAVDMAEEDYRNAAEQGLAMTIVALVDEVSWLQAQLQDAADEEAR